MIKIAKILEKHLKENTFTVYRKILSSGIEKSFKYFLDSVLDELEKLVTSTKLAI